jgi:hypothetical protein
MAVVLINTRNDKLIQGMRSESVFPVVCRRYSFSLQMKDFILWVHLVMGVRIIVI